MTLTFEDFLAAPGCPDFISERALAVAVSGGPDSLALAFLLFQWAEAYPEAKRPELHFLTVDHGLRPESVQEALSVQAILQSWGIVTHSILTWAGGKPQSRVQEEARRARYALMGEYCRDHGIRFLFLGHHQDDQAETFLLRLAGGSGLDGLACMKPVQDYGDVQLVRPLLRVSKEQLLSFCNQNDLRYVQDPSNQSEAFARVRLRRSMNVLKEEGLSSERLCVAAQRFSRAREALEFYASQAFDKSVASQNPDRFVFNKGDLFSEPFEMVLRVVDSVFHKFSGDHDFGPRRYKVENLVEDLVFSDVFRKRTLGGVQISRDDHGNEIVFERE